MLTTRRRWLEEGLHATQMARLFYSIYVGSQHIIPPIQGTDLAHLYREAQQLLRLALGSAPGK